MDPKRAVRVGLLSDTHGLLRAELRPFLSRCDYIVHGGDVGSAAILEDLEAMAPLIAVRGNNDTAPWARRLKETELFRIAGVFLYAIHDLKQLAIDPVEKGVRVVIFGHSHKPKIEDRAGVLYINPGSCGPRRFKLPISLGELCIEGQAVSARTFELGG